MSKVRCCHRCRRSAHTTDSRGRPVCPHCDPLSGRFFPRDIEPQRPKTPSDTFNDVMELLADAEPVQWVTEGNLDAARQWQQRILETLKRWNDDDE